ncbi:MAG: SAM-dependent methyltransferase [Defluviitaleaceae bacterium]|nr:SAM-dependent methyltransferase [Defluviitaleaceae bacterium]
MNNLPFNDDIYRVLLSAPVKKADGYTRAEILSNGQAFQASLYTKTQVFHKNLQASEVLAFIESHLGENFAQYTAWDGQREYSARVTKKGKLLTTSKACAQAAMLASEDFNRRKNHIISEGAQIPALVDMGVFSKTYKVAMYDKFQQINRFLELLADETKQMAAGARVNIIDFGCGKSYLTFLVYHYFVEMRGLHANICGLDLNEDIIQTCRAAAEKYGHKRLTFQRGDIGQQPAPPLQSWGEPGSFNIVISLHACDTATDHALANAVKWQADLICAVPCCQHELRNQMKPSKL